MGTSSALTKRIEMVTSNDTVTGLLFEGALRHLASISGQEAVDQIRREVLKDYPNPMSTLSKYPLIGLLRTVERTLATKPAEPYETVVEGFGGAAVGRFFTSAFGRAMLAVSFSDPHRLMSRTPAGYKWLVSYGERSYKKTGPTSATMTFEGELLGPTWQAGVFRKALEVCKVKPQIDIQIENDAATNFRMNVSW